MTYSVGAPTPLAETMSLSDDLDSLRASFAACETVAFADLSSRMVLVTSSERKLRQEALDALCEEAGLLFEGPKGGAPIFSSDDGADTAIFATQDGVDVFLRATSEPTDVLCCRCGAEIDVAAFITEARAQLEKISGGTGS